MNKAWGWALACNVWVAFAHATETPALRYVAPIEITTPGTFVQLALPPSAFGRSESPALMDLRVVDARNERVPFALLEPRRPQPQTDEQQRDAKLYPLPAQPAADGSWRMPLDVTIQGSRVQVRTSPGSTNAPARSAGWLIDLGERANGDPAPHALRLAWTAPAEFSASFTLHRSDDLRQWHADGVGQVMALRSPEGPLSQALVALGSAPGRFVRLVWDDISNAPALSGAKVLALHARSQVLDEPVAITLNPSAEPATAKQADKRPDVGAERALHFDLGGVLPLSQLDLHTGTGTRVTPARVQVRDHAQQPWREVAGTVFYRIERGNDVSSSPPLAVATAARYVRVLPDPRAAALDATRTTLVVQAPLPSLVFAAQGQAPYRLQAGARVDMPAYLPVSSLVPALDNERARFGRAVVGTWTEVEQVARAAQAQEQRAALRPWLLWSVLIAGVAAMGFMVWRLARAAPGKAGHNE